MKYPTKIKFLIPMTVIGGEAKKAGSIVSVGNDPGQTPRADAMQLIEMGRAETVVEVEGDGTMTTATAAGVLKDETKGKGK